MFYLNKIVGFLCNPVVPSILLGGVAVLLVRRGKSRWAKWIGGFAVCWLWFWMTPLAGRIVGATLESEFLVDGRVPEIESYPNADAIVLLGGGMGVDTNWCANAEMWTSADRVWQTARLWKAGKAKRIFATGPNVRESTGGLLADFGVPEIAVVFLGEPRNTEEEAKAVGELLVEGCRLKVEGCGLKVEGGGRKPKALLVTSAWHMKRARMMFEKYAKGIEVICAPTDFENSLAASRPFSMLELIPNPGSFLPNSASLHEWIGIVGYKLLR